MRLGIAIALVAACAPPPKEVGQVADEGDTELETQIMLLQSPFGDESHLRGREAAARWLVEQADRAYPRLLAMARAGEAGPAVVELLPAFGRAESVGVLEALLAGPERLAGVAGQALARHHGPEALAALRRAVELGAPEAAVAAADGIATRRDPAACPELTKAATREDARVRYHAVQAAGSLGCFSRAALTTLANQDPDTEVRALAAKLLAAERVWPDGPLDR